MLPRFDNPLINTSLGSFLLDMERSRSLAELDLHLARAWAYLRALMETRAIAAAQSILIGQIFEAHYDRQFRRQGEEGLI